jgi:hypothetical protein
MLSLEALYYGMTSLAEAARYGELEVVRILLLAGADVAPCLRDKHLFCENVLVNVATAAYDSAGALAVMIARLPVPARPTASVAAAWAGTAAQAQQAWLMDALARALRGKCKLPLPLRGH